ncbi:MAG: hypothetical protein ACLUES_13285 [Flavonifractor plautii]
MGNDRQRTGGTQGDGDYLDELFLLNFVVDYLLLLAAGPVRQVLRRGPGSAAIGAAYAAAAVLPGGLFFSIPSASWGRRCWPCWRATAKAAASCG